MLLALRVLSRPDEDPDGPSVAHFDERGGLIGRADTARLVLPDPKRTVSRFHAHISFEEGRFLVEDMGSTNPAAVNGKPLASGQRVEVRHGDRLRIGSYMLAAELASGDYAPDAPAGARAASEEIFAHTRIVSRDALPPAGMLPAGRIPQRATDLWRAFQDGAETAIELPEGPRPETLHLLGAMMKSVVVGLRRLMQQRLLVRQEIEGDAGALRGRPNNPLKFSPDDSRALAALIKPPLPGFSSGPQAIDEVMADLQAHSAAMRTAMQRAVEHVLSRFEPQALEQQLQGGGMLQRFIPGGRKAALWDLYLEQQRAIRNDAAEAFQAAFAQAFTEAYERELAARQRPGTISR